MNKQFRDQLFAMDTSQMSKAQQRKWARMKSAPAWRQRLFVSAMQSAAAHAYQTETGSKPGTLGDGELLKWFFSNPDKVFSFISAIMKLFMFV